MSNKELIERGREFARSTSLGGGKHLVSALCDALEATAEPQGEPSDDEREALATLLDEELSDVANLLGRERVLALADVALGFRRSEPSVEHPDHSKLGPSACPACDFDPMASQGEPSDAQVRAASLAYAGELVAGSGDGDDAMRAALRAAGGV